MTDVTEVSGEAGSHGPVQSGVRGPAILILRHYRERISKCSVERLRDRPGIEFRTIEPVYPNPELAVHGGIVLALDAPLLDPADQRILDHDPAAALIIVDGTWRRIRSVVKNITVADGGSALAYRALPPSVRTAYPRQSKLHDDPEDGLSSLEAIVAALHLLGYECARDILDGYRWAGEFLALNESFFAAGKGWDAVARPTETAGEAPRRACESP